ncbi:MAG TPA: AmmeMemoRadiSam system protein A [Anaerolineaceae bacterium]|nr:AmmeMemoRadiSam system protein A [Anaerolineaceae bacterium]
MPETLTAKERETLLLLARQSIRLATQGNPLPPINLDDYPEHLREWGVTFVTLMERGELRGCVGALEAYQPLVEDVCEHAVSAALNDYRFLPVRPEEVDYLHIEISRLTPPVRLDYQDEEDLLHKLHPGVDGVLIRSGPYARATFLPQVWQKLPDPTDFMNHLCLKMGCPASLWRRQHLEVSVYQVEEFEEEN